MAHTVTTDGYISIGGTDQSAHCKSWTLNHSVEAVDDTCFGDTFHQRVVGLQDLKVTAEFNNELTDNDLDEDLDALMGTTTAVALRWKDDAISTANPEYQFTGIIESLNKNAAVGGMQTVSVSISIATTGLTRDVTP